MLKIISASLSALAVLAPVSAMAAPADPASYSKFRLAYTEQRQLESKAFRACLAKAEKPARSKKGALHEEVMPQQSNCMAAETKRLREDFNLNFSHDMTREEMQIGLTKKWATNPTYQPNFSPVEKLMQDQQTWMDSLDQKCMANFDLKADDPKIVMPYFQSCVLTETMRRTIWYQRSRGDKSWSLLAEKRTIELKP